MSQYRVNTIFWVKNSGTFQEHSRTQLWAVQENVFPFLCRGAYEHSHYSHSADTTRHDSYLTHWITFDFKFFVQVHCLFSPWALWWGSWGCSGPWLSLLPVKLLLDDRGVENSRCETTWKWKRGPKWKSMNACGMLQPSWSVFKIQCTV